MIFNWDEPENVQDNVRITIVTHSKAGCIKPQRTKLNITNMFQTQLPWLSWKPAVPQPGTWVTRLDNHCNESGCMNVCSNSKLFNLTLKLVLDNFCIYDTFVM
jgi:hypothetical protein